MSKDDVKPDWAMNMRERANAERVAQGMAPKRRRKWPWLVGLLVVLAGAGGWAVQSGKLAEYQAAREAARAAAEQAAAEAAARPTLIQIAPFEVTTLALAPLQDTLKVTGSLAPVRQVHLSSEVTGRILEVSARAGDRVAQGDVLVRFDTETLESQLAQARSNAEATRVQLEQARSVLERTRNLVDRGLSATTNLEQAQSSLDQLTASLAAQETLVANAELARDRATVRAPFDGFVSERSVDPGAFVGSGTPLLSVVDLTSLEVEATAPITASPQLKPGQQVAVTVEGFGERRFPGSVDRLGPVAIEGSRMLPVYVALTNDSGELRGGMFASGRIVLAEKPEGLGLPAAALRQDSAGDYVLVLEGGLATRRAVSLARSWDGGAVLEVDTGLAPGDVVVSEPLPELKPGMQVELLAR